MPLMPKHPEAPFFEALRNFSNYDAYSLKIIISFVSLVCEKFGESIIKQIIAEGIPEYIENIQYTYQENEELVMMIKSLLDEYI